MHNLKLHHETQRYENQWKTDVSTPKVPFYNGAFEVSNAGGYEYRNSVTALYLCGVADGRHSQSPPEFMETKHG